MKLLLAFLVVLGIFSISTVFVFAQPVVLNREAICVEQTYPEGAIIPESEFSSVQACDSYLQSFFRFYEENQNLVGPSTPDENTACGGQTQFACINGCDTGFSVTEYGTCIASGVTPEQNALFRGCIELGSTTEYCENLAFGGRENLASDENELIQGCIDEGGDPAICRLVVYDNPDIVSTINPKMLHFCIANDGLDTAPASFVNRNCGGLTPGFVESAMDGQINGELDPANARARNYLNCSDESRSLSLQRRSFCEASIIGDIDVQLLAPQPTQPLASSVGDAVVTILSRTNLDTDRNRQLLDECITSLSTKPNSNADSCVQVIRLNQETNLTGAQMAFCISSNLRKGVCADLRMPPIVSVTLASAIQNSLGITSSQPPRNQVIADCVAGGVSDQDCKLLLQQNAGVQISGHQLATCVQRGQASSPICRSLSNLESIKQSVACEKAGACVEGRTCVLNQAQGVLQNIGATCGQISAELAEQLESKQIGLACDPSSDKFGSNNEADAICCGGGRSECASGICNASLGEVGLCVDAAVVGGASSSSQELATGFSDEDDSDCSRANGLVQGTKDSGFVLKCDFDGNGSFGYHQPTQFIYGAEAAATCAVLCIDPTTQVEKGARQRYRELQVASQPGSSLVGLRRGPGAAEPSAASLSDVSCDGGTFVSSFACVAWHRGPCIVNESGCYAKAASDQISSLCPAVHQQSAYRCSEIWAKTCDIHPETGCYAQQSVVEQAEEEFADAINLANSEINQNTYSAFQRIYNSGTQFIGSVADGFSSFWGSVLGGFSGASGEASTPDATNGGSVGELSVPATTDTTSGELLNGGIGITDRAAQNNGEMQVERYCEILDPDWRINENNTAGFWECLDENGAVMKTLGRSDFSQICQRTYNNQSAIAEIIGTDPNPAYNWRCVQG